MVYQLTEAAETKYEVLLYAIKCGKDLSVTICGGSHHHVGAVVLACGILPDKSVPKYSATVNVLSVLDHKDAIIAQDLAGKLADRFRCQVSMTVGIHIDNASQEEIKILFKNAANVCKTLRKLLGGTDETN
jgi:hypothetical protein